METYLYSIYLIIQSYLYNLSIAHKLDFNS